MRRPRPWSTRNGGRGWSTGNFARERPELPIALAELFALNAPDMIALGLGLLPVFVEAQYVWLSPEILPDLQTLSL